MIACLDPFGRFKRAIDRLYFIFPKQAFNVGGAVNSAAKPILLRSRFDPSGKLLK
jgi:hypothetical protein